MEILSAFLAFSAIMIVLSTMATTLVEGIHKLMRQRSKDFERMLKNYYQGSVAPLVQEKVDEKISESADSFVTAIRNNPAFDHENQAEKAKGGFFWKIKKHLFDTAFEVLSTPEFVEQLARSKVGEKIGARISKGEDDLIVRLASEFERYGDAARNYFARRAQVLSILVAIILAFILNVDSIRLFQALASDNDVANRVLAQIDVDEWEKKYNAAKEISAGKGEKFETIVEQTRIELVQEAEQMSKWDLPIGHSFFPYCSGSATANSRVTIDPKCDLINKKIESEIVASKMPSINQSQGEGQDKSADTSHKVNPQLIGIRILLISRDFWAWMINTLLAGLLIGLGAPFWFNTYRSLSDYFPGIRRGATTETRVIANNQQTNDRTLSSNTAHHETVTLTVKERDAGKDDSDKRENLAKNEEPKNIVIHQPGVANRSQLSTLFSSALHPNVHPNVASNE